ncbi:MAG: DUF2272 domain-containing protein [Pirellulaceae bacterium]|nr:DUF2272 domain-containing protein [Pirellulaceae bacterium]
MLMTQCRNLSSIRLVWWMAIWLLTSDSAWGQTFGRLQIRSQPNGATVSITQGARQVTPKKTPAEWVLQPGSYQVRLSKSGYQDLAFSVKILADKKRSFAKVMQTQSANSGGGNVPVSSPTANHILEAARQSFRNRKKYYVGNQKDAFFPGALELASGMVPVDFREAQRFQYSQGVISANGALPGDIFVLRRGNKREVLVYAGEYRFPDSVSKRKYSFFYYPFRQQSGMQLNTYPMRYEHHWMTSHKLLTPSKKGQQQMYSSGAAHEVAKFVEVKIDRRTVKFLKSPGINGRVMARHPPAEVIVYRRDPDRLRTIRMVRFKETSLSTISRFKIEGTDISGYFLEPPGPSTTQSGKNRRIPAGVYDLRSTWDARGGYFAIGLSNDIVPKERRVLIHYNLSNKAANYIRKTPWSAGFISFVVSQTGAPFTKMGNHVGYAQSLRTNPRGWQVLNPYTTALNLGDIVVKNREYENGTLNNMTFNKNPWDGPSHGDIVTAINSTSVTAIGGNVANSVTTVTITTNSQVIKVPGYFVVLRPPPQFAQSIVDQAKTEFRLWSSNNWKETSRKALFTIYKYYEAGYLAEPLKKFSIDTSGGLLPGESYSSNWVEPSATLLETLRAHFIKPAGQDSVDDGTVIKGGKLIITEEFK